MDEQQRREWWGWGAARCDVGDYSGCRASLWWSEKGLEGNWCRRFQGRASSHIWPQRKTLFLSSSMENESDRLACSDRNKLVCLFWTRSGKVYPRRGRRGSSARGAARSIHLTDSQKTWLCISVFGLGSSLRSRFTPCALPSCRQCGQWIKARIKWSCPVPHRMRWLLPALMVSSRDGPTRSLWKRGAVFHDRRNAIGSLFMQLIHHFSAWSTDAKLHSSLITRKSKECSDSLKHSSEKLYMYTVGRHEK